MQACSITWWQDKNFLSRWLTTKSLTIDVMVDSPSKKQMREWDMLQSFGNLYLVGLIICYELERV